MAKPTETKKEKETPGEVHPRDIANKYLSRVIIFSICIVLAYGLKDYIEKPSTKQSVSYSLKQSSGSSSSVPQEMNGTLSIPAESDSSHLKSRTSYHFTFTGSGGYDIHCIYTDGRDIVSFNCDDGIVEEVYLHNTKKSQNSVRYEYALSKN